MQARPGVQGPGTSARPGGHYGPAVDPIPVPGTYDRPLGTSDLRVGPIAYGCWRFAGTGVAEATAKISTALDSGMTLIDTADIYGFDGSDGFGDAEELLGRVLAGSPALRDRMVLATKGGIRPGVPYDQGHEYLTGACEASLRRLGVESVDLYQVHRPDVLTHPEALATTLRSLVDRGLTRTVGVSNFTASHTRALRSYLGDLLATTQPEWSALCLDPLTDGTFDLCAEFGITALAWSPLAGGRLTVPEPDEDRTARVVVVLDELAAEHGVDRAAIALAWTAAHPAGVVPIIGTQRVERIESLAVASEVHLDRSQWYRVLSASLGARLP